MRAAVSCALAIPTGSHPMHRLLAILLAGAALPGAIAADRITGESFATRSKVHAPHAMAATSHPLATQVALDVMKAGGSAVDAAIAANAFLGFADPAMNGPGGDLFAIIWSAEDQQLYGLNASGKSPEGLTAEYFKEKCAERVTAASPHAVTVPGAVDGWFEMHGKFGRLEFAALLELAIRYAREGIAVHAEVA